MTNQEFSDAFSTLLNSYNTMIPQGMEASGEIALDEYEKSLFLTLAQEEIIISLYNGKNPYGESFEKTEELRRYLDGLVKTKVCGAEDRAYGVGVSDKSIFFKLPDDLAYITMEEVRFGDEELGCANGTIASVYPITQDEYHKVKNNPFRGATKYKVLRLDAGDHTVELISNYGIDNYLIRYLAKPSPIILIDLPDGLSIEKESKYTECKLNPNLHKAILERAVNMALQTKGLRRQNDA